MTASPSHGQDQLVVRARAFDAFASQFDNLYFFTLKLFGSRHRKALAHIQGPRVLEVSFGSGYLLSQYANNFETVGIDYNPRYVETTARRLAERGVRATLHQGDAHALQFPDASFDSLVNTDAFTLYEDPAKAMSEFYRVLAPGGRLILMEYNLPKNRSRLGMFFIRVSREFLKQPYVDFDRLLTDVGFEYEDHAVGGAGVLHMYVATKPLTASGTNVAPARS